MLNLRRTYRRASPSFDRRRATPLNKTRIREPGRKVPLAIGSAPHCYGLVYKISVRLALTSDASASEQTGFWLRAERIAVKLPLRTRSRAPFRADATLSVRSNTTVAPIRARHCPNY
jgi:hypothetical protein